MDLSIYILHPSRPSLCHPSRPSLCQIRRVLLLAEIAGSVIETILQVPENADDKDLITAARDIMMASAQKFKLTYLSCKRDMSTLLALSAIQVLVVISACLLQSS